MRDTVTTFTDNNNHFIKLSNLLGEHRHSTNWGDSIKFTAIKIKSKQIKCWFFGRGENRSTRRKTSWSKVEPANSTHI